MKKFIAITFLLLYLISTTELCQLLKLPVLVDHFSEHQSLNSNLSFLDFISMHYAQENDHDGDSEKDNKLPFKSHSCCNETISFATLVVDENIFFYEFQSFKIRKKITNCYKFLLSSIHLKAIWQPPQFC